MNSRGLRVAFSRLISAKIRHANCKVSTSAKVQLKRAGRLPEGPRNRHNRTLTLNTGASIPAIGLGTWRSKTEVGAAVETAIKVGYRHIDCAPRYGNQEEVGKAIKKCFREGVTTRDHLFVTSKLWIEDHAYEDVLPACQNTLKDLQLDYLDLYLSHWPLSIVKRSPDNKEELIYDPELEARCWEAMEELVRKGLVKAIGISNFSITKTKRLLQTAEIGPAVNQVECHPYLQQEKLKKYCDSEDILLECYSPLGNPQNHHLLGTEPVLIEDPAIAMIAKKHNNASPAQICIAFGLHQGNAVIPKSITPSRIAENFEATEIRLDNEDMEKLKELGCRNIRYVDGDFFKKKGWIYTDEYLWDRNADARLKYC